MSNLTGMQTALEVVSRPAVTFFVPGKPASAGSKTQLPIIKNGQVVKRVIVESGDRKAKSAWRSDVRDEAKTAMREQLWVMAEPGDALELTTIIVRARPSEHLGTGRNAGTLKPWAFDLRPTPQPDSTKLVRAIEDALTKVLWHDDSQIVRHVTEKVYGDQVGATTSTEGALIICRAAAGYDGPLI
jgi:Holliday junction resolvase RusA-like endonuclease